MAGPAGPVPAPMYTNNLKRSFSKLYGAYFLQTCRQESLGLRLQIPVHHSIYLRSPCVVNQVRMRWMQLQVQRQRLPSLPLQKMHKIYARTFKWIHMQYQDTYALHPQSRCVTGNCCSYAEPIITWRNQISNVCAVDFFGRAAFGAVFSCILCISTPNKIYLQHFFPFLVGRLVSVEGHSLLQLPHASRDSKCINFVRS